MRKVLSLDDLYTSKSGVYLIKDMERRLKNLGDGCGETQSEEDKEIMQLIHMLQNYGED